MTTVPNPINTVMTFPPLAPEDAAKVTNLLPTMGEFMDVKFLTSEVRVLQVEFDAQRLDVKTVLNKIITALKNKK